ncbi:hypothetical protein L3Q82_022998, partial [Scortum barcoo]
MPATSSSTSHGPAESFQRISLFKDISQEKGTKEFPDELNIPWNTVKTVIIKWRKYGTTVTL